MKLKEGIVLNPFGPSTQLDHTNKISESTAQYLIEKKLCTASDFEGVEPEQEEEKTSEPATAEPVEPAAPATTKKPKNKK